MKLKLFNNFNVLGLLLVMAGLGFWFTMLSVKPFQNPIEAQVTRILEEESSLLMDPRLRAQFVSYLVATAKDHEFDPLLILAIMKAESSFQPSAISNRGAVGLLQVKPIAAQEVSKVFDSEWIGFKLLKDPFVNVRVGVQYLSYLKGRFGNSPVRILSAYNLGPTKVKRSKIHSTKYARKVLKIYTEFLKKYSQA